MSERPYIYWKEDPNLNLVKIDDSVKNPQYDPETNARIQQAGKNAAETMKLFMDELKSKDLVTESTVKKANITGDPAHDKYPDRAVIKISLAIDKQTNQPKLYENGPLQGKPMLNVIADIGHESSHAVIELSSDGKNIRNALGREVMGRGEPPKWFRNEEIAKSPLLNDSIKTIISEAQNFSASTLTKETEAAKNADMIEIVKKCDLNVVQSEAASIEGMDNIVLYQNNENQWKYFNFETEKSGDAIALVQELSGLSRSEAIKFITDDNKDTKVKGVEKE